MLKLQRAIQGMVFNHWGIQNPHACHAHDLGRLPDLPCLAPLVISSVSDLIDAIVKEKNMATHDDAMEL